MRRQLSAAAALLLAASAARGHGPAPAPLGALAAGDGTPAVVRTSIGLAFARGDGTYAYGCPSAWRGGETALSAATPDGTLVVTVSGGVASRSIDAGCSFEPLAAEAGLSFSDVARARGAIYLLGSSAARSVLARVRAAGPAELVAEFAHEGEGALRPDGLAAFEGDAGAGLLLAGARPTPAAVAAQIGAGDGPLALTPLGPLPLGAGVVRLVPRAALASGEAFLLATEGRALRLVHAPPAPGAPFASPPAWAAETGTHDALFGPTPLEGRWLRVRDGNLEAAEIGQSSIPPWAALGPVDWTCLSAVDGVAYACTLPALLRLGAGPRPLPLATPAFSLAQLGPPDPACARLAGDHEACASDWAHFAAEAGLFDTDPATTPEGSRLARPLASAPAASEPDDDGCSVGRSLARNAPQPWAALASFVSLGALAGLVSVRRRWRSLRPPSRALRRQRAAWGR